MSQSPDDVYQELFEDVQRSRIFPDSKTFCDVIPRQTTPEEILAKYRQEKSTNPKFDLAAFVSEYFTLPETTVVVHENRTIEEHCHQLWPLLTRITSKEKY
jgi:alpha,alpha-trehalase